MPSVENGKREVLDPITNLPLTVHDVTDVELEKIPPSLSTVEERHRASTQESRLQRRENGLILDHVEWWSNPDSYLDHVRIQAALVAGVTAGFGAILVLFSWWLLRSLSSRQIFPLADLFILVTDCCLFGIGVGIVTVSFSLPPSIQIDSIVPPSSQHPSRSHLRETGFGSDSTEWINSLFRSVWPMINPALLVSIADSLEDSLQHSLPKPVCGVRIVDIGQGVEPIRILDIQSLTSGPASDEKGGSMDFEVAFAYRSRPSTPTMGLKGRSANLHMLVVFYMSGGLNVPACVELTGFLGTVRMRIQLTPNPPFLARVTLTLLGQPKVTTDCTPLTEHTVNKTDVSILSGWLQRNVNSVIAGYVAPRSTTLDLRSMLLGTSKMDVDALGAVIVTIRQASRIKIGGGSARKSDVYVTLGWSKWGKVLWATRIISGDKDPVWEETTAILVNPPEVDAQEAFRIQVWDVADGLVGMVDVPLSELMHSSETLNLIMVREDQFRTDSNAAKPSLGKILWECGYFEKTTLKQHLDCIDKETHVQDSRGTLRNTGNYEQVKASDEGKADQALCEALIRRIYRAGENDTGIGLQPVNQTHARAAENLDTGEDWTVPDPMHMTSEIAQQNHEDLISKSNELIAFSSASLHFPSGILSIRIEQLSELGAQKFRGTGAKEAKEEDADDLPSAYCEVVINHQRVYKTRTKMKSDNPFFDAKTEKFIRSWVSTNLIIAVHNDIPNGRSEILGVVVLPLASIFRNKSYYQNSLPIVGGVGYGRLKFELMFRSIQGRLPRRLLGWDVGTLEIHPRIFAVPNPALDDDAGNQLHSENVGKLERKRRKKGIASTIIPSDLAGCRLVLCSRYSKGKMFPFHPTHYRSLPEQRQARTEAAESQHHPAFSETTADRLSDSVSSITSATDSLTAPRTITPPWPSAFERAQRGAEAEWRPKHQSHAVDTLKPLRLAVLKRYACCIHILFRRSSHLCRDTTIARSVLWLKDIPDEEEVVVQLPIRRERPAATESSSAQVQSAQDLPQSDELSFDTNDHDDEVVPGVMITLRLRFWRGLSGYHQSLALQNNILEDVMEILDCTEEQENLNAGMTNGKADEAQDSVIPENDESDDDGAERGGDPRDQPESHSPFGEFGMLQQERIERGDMQRYEFLSDAQTQRDRTKESHRKHRGLMQWKCMREMAWVGHGIEHKAGRLSRKVKSGFKHHNRDRK